MKQNFSLAIFIILLTLIFINCSQFELESSLWKNIVNKFLSAPGSYHDNLSFNFKSVDNLVSEPLDEKSNSDNQKIQKEGWLSISSVVFKDGNKFPVLPLPDGTMSQIRLDNFNTRINEKYSPSNINKNNSISPSEKFFWFRLSGKYLYYTSDKKDINVLGSILVSKIENIENMESGVCFRIVDVEKIKWILCSEKSNEESNSWFCYLQASIGIRKSTDCTNQNKFENLLNSKSDKNIPQIQEITQPVIIIPQRSRFCNQHWDYKTNGNDWECNCKDGKEQSPVDLPTTEASVDSNVRPLFEFNNVDPVATEDSPLGLYKTGEKIKLVYHNFSLRIFHSNFGKIVTVNGSVYQAQEIVFRTPSEHTINGQRFEMEMQVIHFATTKGDFGKKAILSFLFKSKPGIYNKFLEKIDFFNLPNPLDKIRDITSSLFIPHILLEPEDDDIYISPIFSFFTYQGSVTEPPCNENTIIYIASKPIDLSTTALQLFKEALYKPDLQDNKGNVFLSDNSSVDNYRNTQPLNGRTIFHFDSDKNNCPEFKKKKKVHKTSFDSSNKGHYERIEKSYTDYVFVNGDKLSGIPGSFVVPEKEALGN
jgi:carbonic anhydrase